MVRPFGVRTRTWSSAFCGANVGLCGELLSVLSLKFVRVLILELLEEGSGRGTSCVFRRRWVVVDGVGGGCLVALGGSLATLGDPNVGCWGSTGAIVCDLFSGGGASTVLGFCWSLRWRRRWRRMSVVDLGML